ncbi:MAG: NAD-dependent epimerase/dehydratase family protein [Lutibacter sp.]
MKKILITGAKGFVGAALLKLLMSKDYDLIETDSTKTNNLCDWEFVKNIPKVDVIIHLAGKSFVPDSFTNPLSFYNNNIISTLNILEKAKKDGAKVIFFSTYVYGCPEYLPIDEEHKMNPKNPYTQSKIIGEELCKAYNRDFNIPVTIFRPFNIYGASQGVTFFIPTIINQLQNKEIHLNDSRPKRDFIYIDDVVAAVEKSININENSFNIYNLGTGVSTSVKNVLEMLVKLSNSKAKVVFSEIVRKGEVLDTIADITKIKKELNWHPKVTIEEGLQLCINNKC